VDETLLIDDGERSEVAAWCDAVEAVPASVRERYGLSCVETGGLLLVSSPGLPGPLFNRVVVVERRVDEVRLDAAIDALSRGGRAYVQVPPGPGFAALRARVEGRLGRSVGAWAKFHSTQPEADVLTEFAVRELGPTDAVSFAQLVRSGFGLPLKIEPWLQALIGRERWRAFGAFHGERLVGTGASFLADVHGRRVAWLGFGVVEPDFRRRGAQGAILTLRRRAALADGAAAVVSETGKPKPGEDGPSFRNLSRTLGLAYVRDNFLIRTVRSP
jgi:hypothetical protein